MHIMDKNIKKLLELIDSYEEDGVDIYTLLGYYNIPSIDIDIIKNDLNKLLKLGYILEIKKDKYMSSNYSRLIIGQLNMNKKGFGIVVCNNSKGEIFIPSKKIGKALDGDIVSIKINNDAEAGKRPEGYIESIISRGKIEYIGTLEYEEGKPYGFVICDSCKMKNDIFIDKNDFNNANSGQKVICKIKKWDDEDKNPIGYISEVLGYPDELGIDVLCIAKEYGLESSFPIGVEKEALKIEDNIDDYEYKRRVDLRKKTIFTIDGADAKDLDDAISIEINEKGNFVLGVHIADVSHYVVENMKLDKEALNRGTSVYLIDRVIPMLPKQLSNGVCSLHPEVDRLTLSIDMEIDYRGNVLNYEIYESVINSKERFVYEDVSDILENEDKTLMEKYNQYIETLKLAEKLAKILMKKREIRGAIDFDFAESKILLDDKKFAIKIEKYERRIANRIIEEFMLVANETIARHCNVLDMPFVYRNHESPDTEKMLNLENILNKNGYTAMQKNSQVTSKTIQSLCKKLKGSEKEYFLSKMILTSLKQAKYSDIQEGHFGLAAEYYCHFTSPIRRYPDLQIHRIIKDIINNRMDNNRKKKYYSKIEDVAYLSSILERRAQEAEREVEVIKKIEYMSNKIGEEFVGMITGFVSSGMFVQLENTVEGFVKFASMMDDVYTYFEDDFEVRGFNTQKIYCIGDKVNLRLEDISFREKEINFKIL